MKTAFVLGNGESRKIFPIELLKGKGTIWGCNAIFRDKPDLCDHIVAVNQPMYDELKTWHRRYPGKCFIHGPNDIHDWNYTLPGDTEYYTPPGLKLYRIWLRSQSCLRGWAAREEATPPAEVQRPVLRKGL